MNIIRESVLDTIAHIGGAQMESIEDLQESLSDPEFHDKDVVRKSARQLKEYSNQLNIQIMALECLI